MRNVLIFFMLIHLGSNALAQVYVIGNQGGGTIPSNSVNSGIAPGSRDYSKPYTYCGEYIDAYGNRIQKQCPEPNYNSANQNQNGIGGTYTIVNPNNGTSFTVIGPDNKYTWH